MIAHGGLAGAIAEGFVALAVAGVLAAVWLRERRGGYDDGESGLIEDGEERRIPRTEEPPR